MAKYEVEMVRRESIDVEASSFEEAVRIAHATRVGFRVTGLACVSGDNGESRDFVSPCEGCSVLLFDSDYGVDSDGNRFCKECFDSLVASGVEQDE